MSHTNQEARYQDHGRYIRAGFDQKGLAAVAQAEGAFPFYRHQVTRAHTPKALARYLLAAEFFSVAFSGGKTILDVGSRDDSAQRVLGPQAQLVDKNNPSLPPWDWEKELLPYGDASFDTVVCLDTLEHINDFHRSAQDVLRVARKHVVISLPNCWRKMFKQMLQGYGTSASYGLPFEKPMDRHKWFFNTVEIEQFFQYQGSVSATPFRVADMRFTVPVTTALHRVLYPLVQWVLPERYAKNLLVNNVFLLLEKQLPQP